jgi:uncharacterized RDD family membrane protein YckC
MENSIILDDIQEKRLEEATKGNRLANNIIDLVAFMFIVFIISLLVGLFGNAEILESESFAMQIIFYLVLFLYYLVMESTWGITLGKLVTGTQVVDMDGNKPDLSTIAIRTLCRFIPFDAISFLGTKGWHDSISKTMVVKI